MSTDTQNGDSKLEKSSSNDTVGEGEQKEFTFETKNSSSHFWASYAKQVIDFEHALGELIDNALSARLEVKGGKVPAFIEVTLEELQNGRIQLQVADNGKGVQLDNLTGEENIFNLGYQPPQGGDMNEHGFGLKNALAMLTSGFQTDFSFFTKPQGDSEIYRVDGPIQKEMTARVASESAWERDLEELSDTDSGVKVAITVKPEYFNTIYNRASRFDTLVRRLGEHLGVMYNRYLENGVNKIRLRYKTRSMSNWASKRIPSIPPPFLVNQETTKEENTITISHDGVDYKATYIQGILDTSIKDTDAEEEYRWPYPLKIHFQGSNARCGVTLTVRDRVLKTGVFDEIWPEKAGDVSFNNFLGELRVNEDFETTNNKTYLDPHSEVWKKLREKLREDFEPEKTTKRQSEEKLRKKVIRAMTAAHNLEGQNKPGHKKVWGGGAEIDVHYLVNGKHRIVETKVDAAKVQDVYQLVMYWDGIVDETGDSPESATLVAEKFKSHVHSAVDYLKSLKDKNGNQYDLQLQDHQNYE